MIELAGKTGWVRKKVEVELAENAQKKPCLKSMVSEFRASDILGVQPVCHLTVVWWKVWWFVHNKFRCAFYLFVLILFEKKNWLEKPRRKWQLKKMDKTTCGCQAILAWQWNMEVAVGTLGTLVILLLLAHVGPPIKRLVKNKNGKINLLSHLHYNGGYFNGIFPQNNARYYICQWLNLTSTSKAAQIIFNFCSKPKTPKVMAKFVMAIF